MKQVNDIFPSRYIKKLANNPANIGFVETMTDLKIPMVDNFLLQELVMVKLTEFLSKISDSFPRISLQTQERYQQQSPTRTSSC